MLHPAKLYAQSLMVALVGVSTVHAQLDNPTVQFTDAERADFSRRRTEAIFDLALPWNRPWFLEMRDVENDVRKPLDLETWDLLVEEVHRTRAINPLSNEMLMELGTTEIAVIEAAGRRGLSEEQVRQAVADFIAVRENARLTMSDGEISGEEADFWVARTQTPIEVSYVVLDVREVVDRTMMVPEEKILAQYNAYRHENPDAPGNPYGFAYALPQRVNIQYITFDRESILPSVDMSESQVRSWFEANRHNFTKVEKFEDAAEEITRHARLSEASLRGDRIAQMLHKKMQRPWKSAQVGADNYKIAPDSVKDPQYLQTLAEGLVRLEHVNARAVNTGLIAISDANKLPEIGTAKWKRESGDYLAFRHLIKRVQGIELNYGIRDQLCYAFYEPMPVFATRQDGRTVQWFVACVTEMRNSGDDASLDEVRDRVLYDIQYSEAFGRVGHKLSAFANASVEKGIESAWPGSDLAAMFPRTKVQHPKPFSRLRRVSRQIRRISGQATIAPSLPDIGVSDKFLDELFVFASEIRNRNEADFDSGIHFMHLFELFTEGKWILAEIINPGVVRDVSKEQREEMASELLEARYQTHAAQWFRPENVRNRIVALRQKQSSAGD